MSNLTSVSNTMTLDPPPTILTGAASDDTLQSTPQDFGRFRDTWQSVIDERLVEWGRDPSRLAEDDLIPPTRASITRALAIAVALRDLGAPGPMRVVPDGDGGVVFERWTGSISVSIEVGRQGKANLVTCGNGRVTERIEF